MGSCILTLLPSLYCNPFGWGAPHPINTRSHYLHIAELEGEYDTRCSVTHQLIRIIRTKKNNLCTNPNKIRPFGHRAEKPRKPKLAEHKDNLSDDRKLCSKGHVENLMQCIGFVYKHTGIQCTTSGLTKKYEKTAMKRVLLQNTRRLTIMYFSYILVSSNIILTYKLVSHMLVSQVKKLPPSN